LNVKEEELYELERGDVRIKSEMELLNEQVKGMQGVFDRINERKKIRYHLEEFVGRNRNN
jgi:hypothetical protein